MSHNALVFGTIHFEELPLHLEHHSSQSLRPSSIEEDEDDPRSLLYLFDDNNFERAAAFLATEEARRHAQVGAEALAEAEAQQRRLLQQQRARALAARLEHLFEEDDELVDMLGRRILATRGYQVPDLWRPQHYHHFYHRHGPQYYHEAGSATYGPQYASSSRPTANSIPRRSPRASDIHAAWDDFEDQTSLSDYARAGPFIHAAPLILQGHAPYPPRTTQRAAVASRPAHEHSHPATRNPENSRHTRIAIHPLTGVPMLLVEEGSEDRQVPQAVQASSTKNPEHRDAGFESEDEADGWPIEDEFDLDWLGRELLRRQGGANVWVLGTDEGRGKNAQNSATASTFKPRDTQQKSLPTAPEATSSIPTSTASAIASGLAKNTSPATPTLPVEVDEVDSDHELAGATSALDPSRNEGASVLSSQSQRVAAALARAALGHQTASAASKTEVGSSGGRSRRQRAATVMSESEEEELETVGVPVDEEEDGKGDDASSLNDRPRKTVKVVDVR
ncbi:hypothetical protein NDA16_004615 [Ustilago loliicola]|nr:hypothetical protein NDA16_004615 [Ustilago loliicola]